MDVIKVSHCTACACIAQSIRLKFIAIDVSTRKKEKKKDAEVTHKRDQQLPLPFCSSYRKFLFILIAL